MELSLCALPERHAGEVPVPAAGAERSAADGCRPARHRPCACDDVVPEHGVWRARDLRGANIGIGDRPRDRCGRGAFHGGGRRALRTARDEAGAAAGTVHGGLYGLRPVAAGCPGDFLELRFDRQPRDEPGGQVPPQRRFGLGSMREVEAIPALGPDKAAVVEPE